MAKRVFDFKIKDIRKMTRDASEPFSNFREKIVGIVEDETKRTENILRGYATDDKIRLISGEVERTIGSYVDRSQYTFKAGVGFINALGRQLAAAETITGGSRMPIYPKHPARKLLFPIIGKSPKDIAPRKGFRKSFAEVKAENKYYFIWTARALLGRLKDSTDRTLRFLFARADSVVVPRKINMDTLREGMIGRIQRRIDNL